MPTNNKRIKEYEKTIVAIHGKPKLIDSGPTTNKQQT
jgi:hypothetical protein